MRTIEQKIETEIKELENALSVARIELDRANDSNDVQGQIDIAVQITKHATQLIYLKSFFKNMKGEK